MSMHRHGRVTHDHEHGDEPHIHDEDGEVVIIDEDVWAPADAEVIEEQVEPDELAEVPVAPEATMTKAAEDQLVQSGLDTVRGTDDAAIEATLRQQQASALSTALRRQAKARQEVIDAMRLQQAAAERDDVPPEVSVEAQRELATAVRHLEQAESQFTVAEQIGEVIEAEQAPVVAEIAPVEMPEGDDEALMTAEEAPKPRRPSNRLPFGGRRR